MLARHPHQRASEVGSTLAAGCRPGWGRTDHYCRSGAGIRRPCHRPCRSTAADGPPVMLTAGNSAIAGFTATTRAGSKEASAAAVEYPYSDGKALFESPRHVDAILYAFTTLRNRFAESPFEQVGASMNLFYE